MAQVLNIIPKWADAIACTLITIRPFKRSKNPKIFYTKTTWRSIPGEKLPEEVYDMLMQDYLITKDGSAYKIKRRWSKDDYEFVMVE